MALALMFMAFEALARKERRLTDESRGEQPRYRRERGRSVASPSDGAALLLTGPLLPTILGDLFVMPVLWAGVLMALSACAYGVDRPGWAWHSDWRRFSSANWPCRTACCARRWPGGTGGAANWPPGSLGLLAWLAFFGLHWWQVSELDRAGRHGPSRRAGFNSAGRAS